MRRRLRGAARGNALTGAAARRGKRPPPYAPPGFRPRLREALVRVAGSDAPGWQARAARRLGVTRVSVSLWANGDQSPGLTTLAEIVRLSGVNAHWLLFGIGPIAAPGTACRLRAEAAPDAGGAS